MVRLLALVILASTTMAVSAPSGHTLEVRAVTFREWITAAEGGSHQNSILASDIRGVSVRFLSPKSERMSMGLALTYGTRHGDPNRRATGSPTDEKYLPTYFSIGIPIVAKFGIFNLGVQPTFAHGPYELTGQYGLVDNFRPAHGKPALSYMGESYKYEGAIGIEFDCGLVVAKNIALTTTYKLTNIHSINDPRTDVWLAQGFGVSVGYRSDAFRPSRALLEHGGRVDFRSITFLERFPESRIEPDRHLLGESTLLNLVEISYLIPLDQHFRVGLSGIAGVRMSEPNGDYPEHTSSFTYGIGLPVSIDVGRVALGVQPSFTRGPYSIVIAPGSLSVSSRHARERFVDRFALNVAVSAGVRITDQLSLGAEYRVTPMDDWLFSETQRRVDGFGVSVAYRVER